MDFAEKIREELFKSGVDVTPTGVVDDLFIRKFIELNAPLETLLQDLKKRLSFINFEDLTEKDQIEFAANYFINMYTGDKAKGKVRLLFDNPVTSFIPKDTVFKTNSGLEFMTFYDSELKPESMVTRTSGLYYYHEVDVIAKEEGQEYNIDPGEIESCNSALIMNRVAKIENPNKFDSGANPETPEQLYNRIPDSLSTRNFSNDPAIKTKLKDKFPSIIDIFNVKAADEKYMFRDIIWPAGIKTRVGNKHDIWVHLDDLTDYTVNVTVTSAGTILPLGYGTENSEGDSLDKVVLEILEITPLDINDQPGAPITDFTFNLDPGDHIADSDSTTPRLYTENSVNQKSQIEFTTPFAAGQKYQIKFIGSSLIPDMQSFVLSDEERMPVGDALVKHFIVYPLYGIIYYKGDIDSDELTDILNTYMKYYDYNPDRQLEDIEAGNPIKKYIEVSDIANEAYRNGVKKVQLPIRLTIRNYQNSDIEFDDEFALNPFEVVRPELVAVKVG